MNIRYLSRNKGMYDERCLHKCTKILITGKQFKILFRKAKGKNFTIRIFN
jgi:hypothetical protein